MYISNNSTKWIWGQERSWWYDFVDSCPHDTKWESESVSQWVTVCACHRACVFCVGVWGSGWFVTIAKIHKILARNWCLLHLLRTPSASRLNYSELFEVGTKGYDNFAEKINVLPSKDNLISPRYKTPPRMTWNYLNFKWRGSNDVLITDVANLALFLNLIFTVKLKKIIE